MVTFSNGQLLLLMCRACMGRCSLFCYRMETVELTVYADLKQTSLDCRRTQKLEWAIAMAIIRLLLWRLFGYCYADYVEDNRIDSRCNGIFLRLHHVVRQAVMRSALSAGRVMRCLFDCTNPVHQRNTYAQSLMLDSFVCVSWVLQSG